MSTRFALSSRVAGSITKNRGATDNSAGAKGLPRSHRTHRLATEIAADGDVLWIDRPGEFTAEPSAAIVGKCADELITERDKRLQRCVCTRARRLNAQSAIAAVVFRACDPNGVGAAPCRIDGQSPRARCSIERSGDHGIRCSLHLCSADAESPRLRAR